MGADLREGEGNYWKALTVTKPLPQDDLLPLKQARL